MATIKEQILALRAEGKSYKQIEALIGCSRGTISYHCSEDGRKNGARRLRDRRSNYRKHIQEVKSSNPCADCGVSYPPHVMDFDHLPGEDKKFNISSQLGNMSNFEVLKAEIAKCEVVCANCHRQRTWERLLKTGESTYEGFDQDN